MSGVDECPFPAEFFREGAPTKATCSVELLFALSKLQELFFPNPHKQSHSKSISDTTPHNQSHISKVTYLKSHIQSHTPKISHPKSSFKVMHPKSISHSKLYTQPRTTKVTYLKSHIQSHISKVTHSKSCTQTHTPKSLKQSNSKLIFPSHNIKNKGDDLLVIPFEYGSILIECFWKCRTIPTRLLRLVLETCHSRLCLLRQPL